LPAYRFEALDAAGKSQSGLVEADNSRAARSQLRSQQLVPLAVTQVATEQSVVAGFSLTRKVFNATALAIWTRQLAGLVGSGLPLERALTALADEAEDARQRELVAHLRSEVNAGAPFARALASVPREFDDVYRGVVAAGEQSGALGLVLERLADDLEARQELKGRLIGATLYPAIVSVIAVVIVVFLVTYVVPQVATVFTSTKRALPLLTVAMIAFSDFLRGWGWLLVLAIAGGVAALAAMLRNPEFHERFDAGVLRLPLVGKLARGYNAARFAGTLAMLAGAGVPILKALQAAPRRSRTAPCAPTRWMRSSRSARVRRSPPRSPARSASPASSRCSRASASRPASCPRCSTAPPASSAAKCSGARCRWRPSSSRC
jgi:general secretion pathway protein F